MSRGIVKANILERKHSSISLDEDHRKDPTCCDSINIKPHHPHNRLYASNTSDDTTNRSGTITLQEANEKLRKLAEGGRESSGATSARPSSKSQQGDTAKIAKIPTTKPIHAASQEAGQTTLLDYARSIIQTFSRAASQPFSNDVVRERATLLSKTLKSAPRGDHKATLDALATKIGDRATLEAIKQFINGYPRWFAETLSEMARVVGALQRMIRRNDHQASGREFLDLKVSLQKSGKTIRESASILQGLYTRFYNFIRGMSRTTPPPKEDLATMWSEGLGYIERRIYDIMNFANIAASIEMAVPELKAAKGPMAPDALKMLNQYDPAHLDFNLQLAVGLNKSFAADHKVAVVLNIVPRLVIPYRMHLDLFWSAYMLISHAVKSADRSKKKNFIRIWAQEFGKKLYISFTDNGLDIKVKHEDLPTIRRLAKKHGWKFNHDFTPGQGTKAIFEIDISRWKKIPPNGTTAPSSGAAPRDTGSPKGNEKAPSTSSSHGMKVFRKFADVGGFAPQNEEMYSSPESNGAAVWMWSTGNQTSTGVTNTGMAPGWIPTTGPTSSVWLGAAHMAGARALPVAP